MDADYDLDAHDERACRSGERRERRYRRVAAAKLPDWVPDALVRELAENLSSTAAASRLNGLDVLMAQSHPDCNDPSCPHCKPTDHRLQALEREGALLLRLATHPDMQGAWKTIATQARNGTLAGKRWARSVDGDGICRLLLTEIRMQLNGDFAHLPKQSAAQAKKSARRVAGLARKLIEAIGDHEGGLTLAADLLGARFAIRNVVHRAKDGEDAPAHLVFLPSRVWPSMTYEPDQRESGYGNPDDEPLDTPPWNDQPAVDRLRWLCGEVRETSLCDLLTALADDMDEQVKVTPQVPRPGSGDPRVRVLAPALSSWMHSWYGKYLDDVVACFVPAILDLEAIAKEDVASMRKRAARA